MLDLLSGWRVFDTILLLIMSWIINEAREEESIKPFLVLLLVR